MKQKDDWFIKFRERMAGYSETPPSDLWEMLDEDLSSRNNTKRKLFFLRYAAAAVIILLLTSVSLYFLDRSSVETDIATVPYVSEQTLEKHIPAVIKEELREINKERLERFARVVKESGPSEEVRDTVTRLFSDTVVSPVSSSKSIPEEVVKKEEPSKTTHRNPGILLSEGDYQVIKKSKETSKWSVGISAGNGMIASSENHYGFSNLNRMRMPATMDLPQADPNSSPNGEKITAAYQQVMLQNINSEATTSVKHHFPVTFGVSLRKNIAERFLLETGIVYTLLSSELRTGGDVYYSQDQKLHYLGIPLKGGWNFVKKERITAYISAGGMVEKCIKSQLKTHYEMQNDQSFAESDKLSVKRLQFSLLTSVGVQFNITDHFGIYAEPGIVYYFDDGTDVSTIRKEKPFNINLQMGLRFGF